MDLETYLRSRKLKASTVKGHLEDIRRFQKWCEIQSIHLNKATYNELLKFIQESQKRGVSRSYINQHLSSIEKYFDYLAIGNNPAKELRIKNPYKKVLRNLLSAEQLEQLYQNYVNRPEWTFKGESKELHGRNIVILGFIIFQGADTAALKKMERSHVQLQKGTVYVPGTSRGNGRLLKRHILQIIPIQKYFSSLEKSEKLFDCKVINVVFWLMKVLRKNHAGFKNIHQIRSSVIMNWLKIYNIRQVQYMAGHKHISSTERYKEEDMQSLQQQVNQFHPLK